MFTTASTIGKGRFIDHYRWLVVSFGVAAFLFSAWRLPIEKLDLRFMLLAAMTVVASSRLSIQIPRFDTNLTVSDTFIFLTLLLYGGEPAIMLAMVEGVCSGLRVSKSKKPLTILFSAAVMACSTFATVWALRFAFGSIIALMHQPDSHMIEAVGTMALVQYLCSTWLVATGLALKTDQPLWQAWSKNCLWSSVTYFAGAATAGLVAWSQDGVGFYGLLITIAIIFIVYFTYSKYLEDIKRTAAQAERSERERAEAEHARAEAEGLRAEQAERHVQELNRYVSELEQTSRTLQESREQFRHAAYHDALTGLPNRTLFADHVKLAIERARRRESQAFAVLFLDLDRFKYINDSLGHTYGDELLITTARRIESCLRQADVVARFGGDEFAVLLDNINDTGDAICVAEKIQSELSAPFYLDKYEAFTTASIGIALSVTGYDDPADILRDADTAMYRAKDGGKARCEVFDKAMHSRAVARLRLENDLRRAVERQEFCVAYQPIIDMKTDKLSGFEALARWQHPERSIVSPAEFIPLAEETGLIVPIGLWILEEACRQTQAWRQQSPANRALTISVNLSGKQLAQPDLIEQIKEILQRTKLDACGLKLEITESVVMENAEQAAKLLGQLRALGVSLSIDDFGTGYSSLSYLHRFPVDTLKIDRSFVSRMAGGDENLEIVRTIITLAGNLGMEVIAEGVETTEQKAQLRALKCDYAQGYLFSPPVWAEQAALLLNSTTPDDAIIWATEEINMPTQEALWHVN
ncbi:MAG: EAL domain-containing protein [Acidobacteriota bacterium]|nr:EAL domain-containing protein [Acidobacteriota bacterium]